MEVEEQERNRGVLQGFYFKKDIVLLIDLATVQKCVGVENLGTKKV